MATLSMSSFRQSMSTFELSTLGIPILLLLILSMLVLPLPPFLLDVLFTFNIILGLVIIMIAVHVKAPLEFSSFPLILLFATMLRLGLNVASTRVVLVKGHEGSDAAGKVIEAFGEFVIAGNYVVGFIVFSILMIINFIVVTKGAGRVSEVIARFTLDAMPGKQMAIDADLNAGVIDQTTAKIKREELSQESDFYGSMDGASKFVRGDAIAGLLILVINILGGLLIGIGQHDLSFSEAGRIYVLLTIGDGLVAQIPSLLLSLSTAIIVTRVTTQETVYSQAAVQLANPLAFFVAAAIIMTLGLVPGMPHFVFIAISAGAIAIGISILRRGKPSSEANDSIDAQEQTEEEELDWADLDQVDLVGVDIGYGLIPLVSPESGGTLLTKIKGVRKKLSAELGFLIQPIRIRDNLELQPDGYNIVISGVVRGRGEIKVGQELAINPGDVHGDLNGVPTKEPAFGLDAYWIDSSQRDYARTLGYTVVDPATAIATHLNTILLDNSSELLSHDETQQLLDKVAQKSPKLVEELVPEKMSLSVITKVLQNLLAEGISVRDMRSVIDVLSSESGKSSEPDQLTALVRPRLGRFIMQNLIGVDEALPVMTLEPKLEQVITNVLQQSERSGSLVIDPKLAESLFKALKEEAQSVEQNGNPAILVISPALRPWLSRSARQRIPGLTVLSYTEIPEDQDITVVGTIDIQEQENEE